MEQAPRVTHLRSKRSFGLYTLPTSQWPGMASLGDQRKPPWSKDMQVLAAGRWTSMHRHGKGQVVFINSVYYNLKTLLSPSAFPCNSHFPVTLFLSIWNLSEGREHDFFHTVPLIPNLASHTSIWGVNDE